MALSSLNNQFELTVKRCLKINVITFSTWTLLTQGVNFDSQIEFGKEPLDYKVTMLWFKNWRNKDGSDWAEDDENLIAILEAISKCNLSTSLEKIMIK